MVPAKTFILLKPFLNYSEGDQILGRFVSNPVDPLGDFAPNDLRHLLSVIEPGEQATPTPVDNFRITLGDKSNINGRLQLLQSLNIDAELYGSHNLVLQADQAITPKLRQFKQIFQRLISHETAQREIYEIFVNNSGVIYMAIGALVLRNGSISAEDARGGGVSGHASIQDPITLTTSLTQISLGGGRASQGSELFSWEGEKVIAVQYCKVVKQSIFSRHLRLQIGRQPYTNKHAVYGTPDEKQDFEDSTFEEDKNFEDTRFLQVKDWETGKVDILADV